MGWETRNGRRYVYWSRRVEGRSEKKYLGRDDAWGRLMLHRLDHLRQQDAQAKKLLRELRAALRDRAAGMLVALAAADSDLHGAAEGMLYAFGYHRHHRGEWRMRRELRDLAKRIEALKAAKAAPKPAVRYDAPPGDAEAAELFAKSRAGDAAAQAKLRGLIAARGWTDWIGDLGRQATIRVVKHAGGGDPVWAAGVQLKADQMLRELAGPNPTIVEDLLARRVVNGWVATHALELDLAVRQPADRRTRDLIDKMISRAQKRMADAARDLARVRRLAMPDVFARVTVATPAALPAGDTGVAMNKEE